MAVPFKTINVTAVNPETVNKIQQNVLEAFGLIDTNTRPEVQDVQSSASIASYSVKPSDVYLVVNARGGPIKIVLPVPNRAEQAVNILNAYDSNPVTVAQADGRAMGNGSIAFTLDPRESALMVNNGKAWFRFGV